MFISTEDRRWAERSILSLCGEYSYLSERYKNLRDEKEKLAAEVSLLRDDFSRLCETLRLEIVDRPAERKVQPVAVDRE